MEEQHAYINHYCREGFWRQLQKFCTETMSRRGNDPIIMFWKAFGNVMEGGASDALRELETLRSKKDTILCSLHVLSHHHKLSGDHDAHEIYNSQLLQEEAAANDRCLFYGAMVCLHLGQYDKGRDYTKRVLERDAQYPGINTVRGWIDLCCGRESIASRSGSFFDKALASEAAKRQDIDAHIGQARFQALKGQIPVAIDTLSEATVLFPSFTPVFVEKARVLVMRGQWDALPDVLKRIQAKDPANLEGLKLSALRELVREGKPAAASLILSDVLASLDRFESKNGILYYISSKPFARLSNRNYQILKHTIGMIERAIAINPKDSKFFTELAFQQILNGNLGDAMKNYKQAISLDDSNVEALHGLIRCQIHEGKLADAEDQLQFLAELEVSMGKSPDLTYLRALLSLKKNQDPDESIRNLESAVDLHMKAVKGIPVGLQFYSVFNPEFLLECARELFAQIGNEPLENAELQKPLLMQISKTLDAISRYAPGIVEVHLLLGRSRFVLGEFESALKYLQQALKIDSSSYMVHMLMAQVYLHQDRCKLASQSLEQALSQSFEVRDSALYHLTNARIQERMGNLPDALRIMENTMLLPGIKSSSSKGPRSKYVTMTQDDRCSVFLFYASLLTKLNRTHESSKVIQDALIEFSNSAQEVRILVVDAQNQVRKGDVDSAIKLLRSINPEKPGYIKAQACLAGIYLNEKCDSRRYLKIYEELTNRSSDPNSILLLGDAYMRVQEPEKAIEKYELALSKNPTDSLLASKIGQVYVNTHDYKKAVDFYEKAVRADPSRRMMRYDLGQLYMRIRKFDIAEQILNQALDVPRDNDDTPSLIMDVKILLLLAKVHRNSRNHQAAQECLMKAKDYQTNVIHRTKGDSLEFIVEQKRIAAQVLQLLGNIYEEQKLRDKAVEAYKEALQFDDSDEKIMTAIASIHLGKGDYADCQRQCNAILKLDPQHILAMTMIAELLFQKKEYDSAAFHFQQLLQAKPTEYDSLSKLIDILRRSGKLHDVERFFTLAETRSPRSVYDPGFQYCKGLFHRYSNSMSEALACFNQARKNGEFGERALRHMIEIYLNPEGDIVWEESTDGRPDYQESLKSVEKLLRELAAFGQNSKYYIIEAYYYMAARSKASIESAIQKLTTLLSVDADSVPALLALSTAHLLQKQQPKARNHLKRIAKMEFNPQENEEFERSWLMLAEIYIEGGKYDLAQELLKKTTQQNRSCAKAWELLGFIMEKEQSYKDAADNYELAWKFCNKTNPAIGFKLAFNYMKDKRFVKAIDVCNLILEKHPNYPKIRKEILDKARASIRP